MSCRILLLALLFWSFSGSTLPAQPQPASRADERAWQNLRRQYLALRTLSGTFEQTICSEAEGTCQSFQGTFAFRLPGEFRLEVSEPVRQVVVGTDSGVWFYFPTEGRAVFQSGGGSVPLLSFLAPVTDTAAVVRFGTDAVGAPTVEITTTGMETLSNLVLELNRERTRITGFSFDDDFGNHHHFRLGRQRWNPRLGAGTFRFSPPAGVLVEYQ
jgi:outer membrane lipoprotein carrier protein